MEPLERTLRSKLERAVEQARDVAESGAKAALDSLGVANPNPFSHSTEEERELRRRLRIHGRQLGDIRDPKTEGQGLDRLVEEVAYEHWHRMLFARFLAENHLLMYPDETSPVAVTLEECEELAQDEGARNGWELASRFAAAMLPQIFRPHSPVFGLSLPPENQLGLERVLNDLPGDIFSASDSLGWVYQFWQAKNKEEINHSGTKIGERELPAVTQLFTEPYMVSFLLDNTLGAWWAARRLSGKDLAEAESEEELRTKAALPGVPLDYLRFVKVNVEAASSRFSSNLEEASSFLREEKDKRQDGASTLEENTMRLEAASKVEEASSFLFREENKRQDAASTIGYFDYDEPTGTLSGNLPHWRQDSVTYFVTFRTADSLPQEKLRQWLAEKEQWLDQHPEPLDENLKKEFYRLFPERLQYWLDSGYGKCLLGYPSYREMVEGALRHFNGQRYMLDEFVVAPNHVHVIVTPTGENSLSEIVHSWKSFTANQINHKAALNGAFWQKESFDHIVRRPEQLEKIRQYIRDHFKVEAASSRFSSNVEEASSFLSSNVGKASSFLIKENDKRQDKRQDAASTLEENTMRLDSASKVEEASSFLFKEENKRQDAASTFWRPAAGTFDQWPDRLSDLKILDPCCGSGHFLVSALSMLVPIRMEHEGISAADAVDAVLRQNLHGLEIDRRCVELAAFALALTAWRYPNAGGYRSLPKLNLACSGLSVSVPKSEWQSIAQDEQRLRLALNCIYDEFEKAPLFGSLINLEKSTAAKLVEWDKFEPILHHAIVSVQSDEQLEIGVVAQGLAKASQIMTSKFHLVITNVPYLAKGKQGQLLKNFLESNFEKAKNDLATAFLQRCIEYCFKGGTCAIVLPQNWLFLTTYKKLREQLLTNETLELIARLGSGAFETISGEVVKAILFVLTHGTCSKPLTLTGSDEEGSVTPSDDPGQMIRGLDVSDVKSAQGKAELLVKTEIFEVEQAKQLVNPDARIALNDLGQINLLEKYATAYIGQRTGDGSRFIMYDWELDTIRNGWTPFATTVDDVSEFSGCTQTLLWEDGKGHLASYQAELARTQYASGGWKQGWQAWNKYGIRVSQMRRLPVTIHGGSHFDNNCATIVPHDPSHLAAIWCYCSSPEYHEAVRQIDQSLKVTNATLVKVPFDLEYWQKIAAEKYPNGLPKPYSDDLTQWIFHGHPTRVEAASSRLSSKVEEASSFSSSPNEASNFPERNKRLEAASTLQDKRQEAASTLQVAVARLLGYLWPAELDENMELEEEARRLIARCKELAPYSDEDGIVCIPPVRGEAPAVDRLMNMLAASYGDDWSINRLSELLSSADHAGKSLETWLRDKFFTQHFKLFHHRPFIWQIWDGLSDGFSVLVNYHKLDRKKLETLIYLYLGDWIKRQNEDVSAKIDGAQERRDAAEALKKKLEIILEGESPYDIFVRWKPIEKQSIGWDPDINDGVRMNIRPFMSAPDVRKKGAGVLRDKPNIDWKKDRGKDVASAPWFHLFDGDRINDHHLTLAEKLAARAKD